MVQTGFSVSLSLVNLIFVLGIIVIALATILRNQSYGIKALLWKLVVMAILVNFGLVIMAPILGFGNSLTQYFVNCIDPSSGGCTGAGSGASSFNNFATQFAGSFKPQSSMMIFNSSTDQLKSINSTQQQNATGAFSALDSTLGQMIIPVFGVGFAAINLILIFIILLVFIVLLIIRYVYIAILAVLLPFAWASWVFPSFQKHWSSWWSNFIRWTFFPPIIIFFIYLALIMMNPGGTHIGQSMNIAQYTDPSTGGTIWKSISDFLGNTFSPLVQAFLQETVLAGLIIGGMIAANSMGIKLAGAVVSTGQKYAGQAATWGKKRAWEKGTGAITKRFRTPEARNKAITQQQPGNGLVTRWRGRLATSAATMGGEKMVDAGKERFKGETAEQNRMNISTTRDPAQKIARIERALADKEIDPSKMTEREISTYFGKDKESTFKQYGTRGEKIYKEAREKSGIEMQDLLKEQSELEQQRTHLENQQANILDQHGNEPELSEEEAAIVGSVPSSLSANEKKLKENKAKQDGLYKKQAAENPEALTAPFQTTEQRGNALEKAQKSGKPLPASVTMDTAGLKKIQESIVRSMTEGFSPANTSGLINALSKNNNLKEFEDAVVEMKKNPQQFKDIKDGLLKNTATLRYFRNNPGKATIDYKKLFDITDAEEDAVLGPRKKKGKS
jgi:hypothetical protein